ncbi:MAG: hypothetical protein KGL44_03505 [Sphingomonadales bacterium]|nr:hypothetical protein [Sphingomonadales bacterium]
MKSRPTLLFRTVVLTLPALLLAGCGQSREEELGKELDSVRAELKQTQDSLHASETALQALRKEQQTTTRYVDDGPSLAPDPEPPVVNPGEAGAEGHNPGEVVADAVPPQV